MEGGDRRPRECRDGSGQRRASEARGEGGGVASGGAALQSAAEDAGPGAHGVGGKSGVPEVAHSAAGGRAGWTAAGDDADDAGEGGVER